MAKTNNIFKSNIIPKSRTDLGYYLAGLIEGDGHFSKKQLIISGHQKDYAFFKTLSTLLGYGTVRQYSKGHGLRFVISSKTGLYHVVCLCNGKFVGYHKYNQLINHNYEQWLNITLLPPTKKFALNNFWFCGFIDADGCFSITVRKCNTSTTKTRVDLRLTIAQKDKFLLEQIQRIFETPHIYESKNINNKHFRLTISGYKRLPMIINYFDTYCLQTCKYIHYRLFRRSFRFMQFKKHLFPEGLKVIKTFKTCLQDVYKINHCAC